MNNMHTSNTRAYVTNQNSKSVSVIDLTTHQVIDTIVVGAYPTGIALMPHGNHIYVANSDSGTVSIIDVTSNTVTNSVKVGDFPNAIAFDPNGTNAYVTNISSQTLSIIDSNHHVSTISLKTEPLDLTVTPDGKSIYITTFFASHLLVIDLASKKVVEKIKLPKRSLLRKMAISPNGSYGYLTNSSPKGHYVTIIDLKKNQLITSLPVGTDPSGISLSANGTRAYVTHITSNDVYFLDLQKHEIINQINVGMSPFEITHTPNESRACVINNGSNSVSIIDLATFKVTQTIEVGTNPYGVVIT